MKIRLIRNTIVDGRALSEGETIDCSDKTAKYLINIKKAVALEPVEPDRDSAEALVETTLKPEPEKRGGKGGKKS